MVKFSFKRHRFKSDVIKRAVWLYYRFWGPDGRDFGDRKVPPHIATTLTRDAVCLGDDLDLSQATRTLEQLWRDAGS